jgi:TonB family protein
MFDRLVESEPAGAVRSRRNYFVVTTLAMSVLSLTAVVISIFADDYSMNASIELSELISPVEMAQVAPEQPQPRQQMPRTQQSSADQTPTRQVNIQNVMETPKEAPPISTTASTQMARPISTDFLVTGHDSNPASAGTVRESGPVGGNSGPGGLSVPPATQAAPEEESAPPRTPAVQKVVSKGVINGQAIYLPKPAYPPAAHAVAASGMVEVQVLIDEQGHVVSAHAANGNPLLRGAAERAAMAARFTPTKLSDTPVKVTGIITYNFLRG